jgi:hypothetical protein
MQAEFACITSAETTPALDCSIMLEITAGEVLKRQCLHGKQHSDSELYFGSGIAPPYFITQLLLSKAAMHSENAAS